MVSGNRNYHVEIGAAWHPVRGHGVQSHWVLRLWVLLQWVRQQLVLLRLGR